MLFSEPKIPQSRTMTGTRCVSQSVSVLFSEPKIPQLQPLRFVEQRLGAFQCSSASRKFLNAGAAAARVGG